MIVSGTCSKFRILVVAKEEPPQSMDLSQRTTLWASNVAEEDIIVMSVNFKFL